MEKQIVLKDPKGLVEKDLTTVYKALETTIPQVFGSYGSFPFWGSGLDPDRGWNSSTWIYYTAIYF